MTATDNFRKLWTMTLRYGSDYNEKVLKGLYGKGIDRDICCAMRQWWSKHHVTSPEVLAAKFKALANHIGENHRSKEGTSTD